LGVRKKIGPTFRPAGLPSCCHSILACDLLNRLYERGLIGDPVNKTKSEIFAEEGLPPGTIHLSLNQNIVKAATAITSVAERRCANARG
jgi:hypothetical protein